jgi:hypothetical protein
VQVLAAPSTEPTKRRANTADTYAFWASTGAQLTRNYLLGQAVAFFLQVYQIITSPPQAEPSAA